MLLNKGVQSPRLKPDINDRLYEKISKATNLTSSKKSLTTGIITVYVAMQICKNVTIYGFGNYSDTGIISSCQENLGVPKCAKYYGHVCISWKGYRKDLRFHPIDMEYEWYRFLESKKHIRVC